MSAVQIVKLVVQALEGAGVPYMITGSLASSTYGIPRSTKDADVVVQLGTRPVTDVVQRLGSDFSLDPQVSFESVTGTTRYRLQYVDTGFVVELFELSSDPHDQERFARRRVTDFDGLAVHIASAEDVIITKLRWAARARRSKDIDDIDGVLRLNREVLDWVYIRQWTRKHRSQEVLDSILRDIENT